MDTTFIVLYVCPIHLLLSCMYSYVFALHIYICYLCIKAQVQFCWFLPQIVAGQACVGPVFVEAFAAPVRPWRSEVFASRFVTAGAFRSAGSSLALGAFHVGPQATATSPGNWRCAVRILGVRWPGRAAMRLGLLLVVARCCRPGNLLGGRICGFL